MSQRHSLEACEPPLVKLANTSDMAHASNKQAAQARLLITLSVRGARTSTAKIHIKTFVNTTFFSSSEHPLRYVYQSTAWPEPLREVEHVTVAVELGGRSDKPSQLAMNHTIAGLLFFLDAASCIKTLRLKLDSGHTLLSDDLLEVFQPVAILNRRMQDVDFKLSDISSEISKRIDQRRILVSRNDDTEERLFSLLRTAARATVRLNRTGMVTPAKNLEYEIHKVLKKMGFVGPGRAKGAGAAVQDVEKLLERLMETIPAGSCRPEVR